MRRALLCLVVLAACSGVPPMLADDPPVRPAPDLAPIKARLTAHVRHLATTIGSRHAGEPDKLAATATWIEAQMKDAGLTGRRLSYTVRGQTAHNLEFRVTGREDDGTLLVLGAHYDCVRTTPGADDNASGVAVLIETARRLVAERPRRTIALVAFTHEEPPYFRTPDMGSYRYLKVLQRERAKVALMISLDMVGYYSDTPQQYPHPSMKGRYPANGTFLAAVTIPASQAAVAPFFRRLKAAAPGPGALDVQLLVAPRQLRGVDFSDHLNFWDAGLPAVMLTDTSFHRNDQYHLPGDTPERLDYGRMASLAVKLAGALR